MVRFDLGPLLPGQTRVAKLRPNLQVLGTRLLGTHLLLLLHFWNVKPAYRKPWAGNFLMWSQTCPWAPPLRSKDGSLASVSCLSGGYNLYWFSNMLGLVYLPYVLFNVDILYLVITISSSQQLHYIVPDIDVDQVNSSSLIFK